MMKICTQCILPETFPGISFNTSGVCSHCQKVSSGGSRLAEDKAGYSRKFLDLLDHLKTRDSGVETRPYDVLMAYSGGKDSTYTMYLLRKKYGLRVLALSFDNGFLSDTAGSNIKKMTDALGIDHMLFKPKWEMLKRIFITASEKELYSKKTLERASTICTSCIGLVKSICLKTAIEQDIPLIGFGWSPGQAPLQSAIMKTNPALARMAQNAVRTPLKEAAGSDVEAYFLSERHYSLPERFPYNVHPMAWEFYNEEMIIEEISKMGWTAPTDTDTNSSNCLLNAYANEIHIHKYGFHPYVWEIANMVRDGVMTRQDGYQKIYAEQRSNLVEIARLKLSPAKKTSI